MKRVRCLVLTVAMLVALIPAVFAATDNSGTGYVSVVEDFTDYTAMDSAFGFAADCTDQSLLPTTQLGDSTWWALAPTVAYSGSKYTSSVNYGQVTADGLVLTDSWTQYTNSSYTHSGKGKTIFVWEPLDADGGKILDNLSDTYQIKFNASNSGGTNTMTGFRFHMNSTGQEYYELAWGGGRVSEAGWRVYKVAGGTRTTVMASENIPTATDTTYIKSKMNVTLTYENGTISLDAAYTDASGTDGTEKASWTDTDPFALAAKDAQFGFTGYGTAENCIISAMSINDYVEANPNVTITSPGLKVDMDGDDTCETAIASAAFTPLSGEYAFQAYSGTEAVANATLTVADRNIITVEDGKLVPLRAGSTTITVSGDISATFPVTVAGLTPYVMDFTAQTQFIDGSTSVSVAKGEKADLFTDWELNRESGYASTEMAATFDSGLWIPGKASAADGAITTAHTDVPRLRYKGSIPDAYTFDVEFERGSTLNSTHVQFMVHNNNLNYYEIMTNDNTLYGSSLCTTEVVWIFRKVVDGAVVESSIVQSSTAGHGSDPMEISATVRGGNISWEVNGETGSYSDPNPFTASPANTTIDLCARAASDGRGNTYKNFTLTPLAGDDTVLSRVDGDYVKVYYNAANAGTTTTPKMLLVPYVASSVTGVNTIGKAVVDTAPYTKSFTGYSTLTLPDGTTGTSYTSTKGTAATVTVDDDTYWYNPAETTNAQGDIMLDSGNIVLLPSPISGDTSASIRHARLIHNVPDSMTDDFTLTTTMEKGSVTNGIAIEFLKHNGGQNFYQLSFPAYNQTTTGPNGLASLAVLYKVVDGAIAETIVYDALPDGMTANDGSYRNVFGGTIDVTISVRDGVVTCTAVGERNNISGNYTATLSMNNTFTGVATKDTDIAFLAIKNSDFSFTVPSITITPIAPTAGVPNATVMDAVNTTGDAFNMISIKKSYGDTFKFFAWDLGANLKNLVDAKSISK